MTKTKKRLLILASLVLILSLGYVYLNYSPKVSDKNQKIKLLTRQLEGETCAFVPHYNEDCQPASTFEKWQCNISIRNCKKECISLAARCLSDMGSEARSAVPALIDALENYPNYDTGDGIIYLRSQIAIALGAIGDEIAISPLIEILESEDKMEVSISGIPSRWNNGSSYPEVVRALGMFGEKAQAAIPKITSLLEIPEEVDPRIRSYKKQACREAVKAIPLIEKNPSLSLQHLLDPKRCEEFPMRERY